MRLLSSKTPPTHLHPPPPRSSCPALRSSHATCWVWCVLWRWIFQEKICSAQSHKDGFPPHNNQLVVMVECGGKVHLLSASPLLWTRTVYVLTTDCNPFILIQAAPEHFELFCFTLRAADTPAELVTSIATMEADKTSRYYNTSTSQSESKIHWTFQV